MMNIIHKDLFRITQSINVPIGMRFRFGKRWFFKKAALYAVSPFPTIKGAHLNGREFVGLEKETFIK
jgi:hypothetical protein